MKFYSLNIWIWADSSYVTICKDSKAKGESFSFTVNHIGGEPNWHRLLETIAYFDSEFVYIAPRFEDADDLTSEPKEDTGRYQSGYRVFNNGTIREDFGSDR